MPDRRIQEDELWDEPDRNLKLNSVQKHLISFAGKRNGTFTNTDYEKHLSETVDDVNQRDYLIKRKSNACAILVKAGYLKEKSRGEYEVNPLVLKELKEAKRCTPFSIKENHIKLLAKHNNGVIVKSALKGEYQDKSEKERYRQEKMIDGMIRNLSENGYLKSQGKGQYTLTALGYEALNNACNEKTDSTMFGKNNTPHSTNVKVTAFDKIILEVCNTENVIDIKKLEDHPRKDTILKRIDTLKTGGYIKDDRLSDDLLQRINIAKEYSRTKQLSFDLLTNEQQQVLKDTRQFLNLYRGQINKYIYKGDTAKADADLKFMVEKGLLEKDKLWNIYVLGDEGIRITNSLYPEEVRYKTKVYSRREEVGHDALVYTAYKHCEQRITAGEKKEILEVKTDRQLRREDAKANGYMQGAYPDLWIKYKDPVTQKEFTECLEVDIQYDERTIRDKVEKILLGSTETHKNNGSNVNSKDESPEGQGAHATGNHGNSQGSSARGHNSKNVNSLSWYCSKASQVAKVAKTFSNIMNEKSSRRVTKAKYLELFFISEDGEVHKYRWR